MTEKQGEASSASAKLEEIQNKLKSGAHWFGGKGSELSTVALPRIRASLDRPLLRWVSGRTAAAAFVAISGLYCFAIGRDRYQATSEFVIKQPQPPATATTTVLGGLQSISVLSSLEDGRYLQVYLESNDVKESVFPDESAYLKSYSPAAPDVWSGIVK